MAKHHEHGLAIALRKRGQSYSEIKHALGVSKSTLSRWLEAHPLPLERIRQLRDWNHQRIEHYRETRRKTREVKLDQIYRAAKRQILPLSRRDLLIGGLFLYWGEGSKTRASVPALSNCDPAMVRFFIDWATRILHVDVRKITIRLHCYSDMDVRKEIRFWSQAIGIPIPQFRKTYVKESKRSALSYKGGFGHGTCNVIIPNAMLGRQVMMSLRVLREQYQGSFGTGQ